MHARKLYMAALKEDFRAKEINKSDEPKPECPS